MHSAPPPTHQKTKKKKKKWMKNCESLAEKIYYMKTVHTYVLRGEEEYNNKRTQIKHGTLFFQSSAETKQKKKNVDGEEKPERGGR